ncbi:hypothetical protein FM893_23015, partial [Salmonella enterica]|nr:hypothetical protein [Salmonella enterica]
GAGWLSAIMPFGTAILCLTLSDEIRALLANKNEDGGIRTGWTLFWALLLPPVGAAIIQAKMNVLLPLIPRILLTEDKHGRF